MRPENTTRGSLRFGLEIMKESRGSLRSTRINFPAGKEEAKNQQPVLEDHWILRL